MCSPIRPCWAHVLATGRQLAPFKTTPKELKTDIWLESGSAKVRVFLLDSKSFLECSLVIYSSVFLKPLEFKGQLLAGMVRSLLEETCGASQHPCL